MRLGVIADDFTGASDIALTLSEAGMKTVQYIGVPTGDAGLEVDAGVVALKSRTAPVEEAVATSLAACEWLLAQGASQIVLKVCSTFDSTPAGNIGPVLDALAVRLEAASVLVCPAFPENGRSVYQGHLFVGDRLLNESGMQDHPLTPMKDADLRRVLAAQSSRLVGHIGAQTVARGAEAIGGSMGAHEHIIIDAITDADLMEIGRAASAAPLLCGGSGIALGLPRNFGLAPGKVGWSAVAGSGVVLSGSCSRATRAQVDRYKGKAPSHEFTARQAVEGEVDIDALAGWVLEQPDPPLVYSSASPEVVQEAQAEFGRDRSAEAIEAVFAALAATLVERGLSRIVVAGGETSGAVTTGLGLSALDIGPRAAAGVPLVRAGEVALALKSGNFGGPDFFAETLQLMAAHS